MNKTMPDSVELLVHPGFTFRSARLPNDTVVW